MNQLQHRSSHRGSGCDVCAMVCIVFEKVAEIVLEAANFVKIVCIWENCFVVVYEYELSYSCVHV